MQRFVSKIPWLFLVVSMSLIFAFFGNVFFGDRQFAFRDGSHFYFPLYKYIQTELASGRFPFWIPYENLGQPLAANPVGGIFYPFKLLFLLPFDFTLLYHVFVVSHVFLASAGMYRLARYWKTSRATATLCAISYAFGGCVLYQHLNMIFLIGAAWMPEFFLRCSRLKHENSFRNVFAIAVVVSMMIFGGDLQAAYHAGIIAFFFIGHRRAIFPFVLASLLASIQIIPSLELSKHSDRNTAENPVSVWELPQARSCDAAIDGLLCRNLDQPTHSRLIYRFSIAPWRLSEYLWPGIGGEQFPVNSRWFSMTPFSRDVWVPSLYSGVIPLILAAGSFRLFRRREMKCETEIPVVFLSRMLLITVLGSLGMFGVGWIINSIISHDAASLSAASGVGNPIGGVYWLANLLLPGYSQFRYPAKLLTLAAVPFSLLAAQGFERLTNEISYSRRCVRISVAIIVVSILTPTAFFVTPLWGWLTSNGVPCLMFGPFNEDSARSGFTFSFFHTEIIVSLFVGILVVPKRRSFLIPLLVAIDLYAANSFMIATCPRDTFAVKSPFLEVVKNDDLPAPPRVYRYSVWYPESFRAKSSKSRFAESVRFDLVSLWPKYTNNEHISIVDYHGTLMLKSYADRLREIRSGVAGFEDRVSEIGTEFVVLPAKKFLNPEKASLVLKIPKYDAAIWKLKEIKPRAWTASKSEPVKITSYDPGEIVIDTNFDSQQTVVVSEQYYPGWTAEITTSDGQKSNADVFPVENIFNGVKVPAGDNTIKLKFVPKTFYIGGTISLSAWAICFIVMYCTKRKYAQTIIR